MLWYILTILLTLVLLNVWCEAIIDKNSTRMTPPIANISYSPVALSNQWPKIARLTFVLFCCCFGSIMNAFFIASFFIEGLLKKGANVFLCALGLADLIVTLPVMATSAIVLLSGQWDTVEVCHMLQIFAVTSTYSYSLLSMLVAVETYFRLCRTFRNYEIFMLITPVEIIVPFIFIISFALGAAGVHYQLDYDYCERQHHGDMTFRIWTSVLLHYIPCVLTFLALIFSAEQIQRRSRRQLHYRRSLQYERDYSLTNLNITAYIIFVVSWVPYIVIIYNKPNLRNSIYYSLAWFGLLRCAITSSLYGIVNPYFRRAYSNIFNYCCCKNDLPAANNYRHRRAEYKVSTGEVKVHILHHAVARSPRRLGNIHETQSL